MKKFLIGMVIVASLVGMFILGKSIGTNKNNSDIASAKKLGQTFASQIVEGNISDAYSNAGSDKLKSGVTLDQLKETYINVQGSQSPKETGSVYVGENNALYLQPIVSKEKLSNGNKTGMFNLILEKQNGEWKVLNAVLQ